MGLFDTISNIFSGGGRNDADRGYKQANQYLDPYRTNGVTDYNNYRGYVGNVGNALAPYNNAGSWQYNHINESPVDYYREIMGGYSESPLAKHEQEQALRASNAAGAASGLVGSGAFIKGVQQNAADISGRDQDRYLGNIGNINQMQMGYLGDLRGRQDSYNAMQQYLTSLGYGGASESGQNSINRGLARSKYDQTAADDIFGLIGAGGQNYKNNYAYNTTGGQGGVPLATQQQIPWYLMFS